MDEEDGRPGALAAQTGRLDALGDVLTVSLRFVQPIPTHSQFAKTFRAPLLRGFMANQVGQCMIFVLAPLWRRGNHTDLGGPKAVGPTAGGRGETQ